MNKYEHDDHTAREIRELEKSVMKYREKYPDYSACIRKVIAEIKPKDQKEALEFELDSLKTYEEGMK